MIKQWLPSRHHREEGTYASVRSATHSSRRKAVLVLLACMVVTGWMYVLFGSPFFRITQVQMGELVYTDRGEVTTAVFEALDRQGRWPWTHRNIFFLDIPALQQELETKLYAEKVTVDKQYPNILRLNIQERQSRVIVIANNEFYLVDRHGIGVERISSEEEAAILQRITDPSSADGKDLPVMRIRKGVYFEAGERFVSESTVQGWLQAFEALSEASFGYRNAIIEEATSTKLILNLYEPYDVYMDLLAPIPPQIQGFYIFLKAKPTVKEYVDVRVPGKVYYK